MLLSLKLSSEAPPSPPPRSNCFVFSCSVMIVNSIIRFLPYLIFVLFYPLGLVFAFPRLVLSWFLQPCLFCLVLALIFACLALPGLLCPYLVLPCLISPLSCVLVLSCFVVSCLLASLLLSFIFVLFCVSLFGLALPYLAFVVCPRLILFCRVLSSCVSLA
jgi:hypothetical protein